MSDPQFVSAIAAASVLNTLSVVAGILINDSKLRELRTHLDALFDHFDRPFDEVFDPRRT
jgi:hypothetical protein